MNKPILEKHISCPQFGVFTCDVCIYTAVRAVCAFFVQPCVPSMYVSGKGRSGKRGGGGGLAETSPAFFLRQASW